MGQAPGPYVAEAGGLPAIPSPALDRRMRAQRRQQLLEAAIAAGTGWLVFEPNTEATWARLRGQIANFLQQQWQAGWLQGTRPDHAFFVRCDRTTISQHDLDNGRLVCMVGVALQKPAEFNIFQLGSLTADAPA
ncbi:MAG: phage tail sheath C-terminal domain-containing protein [Sphingomonadales bacterium]|jgi:phage tail sheath protein FI